MTTRVSIAEVATRTRFNSQFRETALECAKLGMSLEGIAHICGVCRKTLERYRERDPEFNSELMAALATFEHDLCRSVYLGCTAESASSASQLAGQTLQRRFPHRHGADPRFRLSAQQAREGYSEDLADPDINATKDPTAEVMGRLVERMLKEDEGQ